MFYCNVFWEISNKCSILNTLGKVRGSAGSLMLFAGSLLQSGAPLMRLLAFQHIVLWRMSMLIDSLATVVRASHALDDITSRLDSGSDAALGVASSARAFVTAALFTMRPACYLVAVPGRKRPKALPAASPPMSAMIRSRIFPHAPIIPLRRKSLVPARFLTAHAPHGPCKAANPWSSSQAQQR